MNFSKSIIPMSSAFGAAASILRKIFTFRKKLSKVPFKLIGNSVQLSDFSLPISWILPNFSVSSALAALLLYFRMTCAFYFEMSKLRLYFDVPSSSSRRSSQTTCHYFLETLMLLLAPVTSFLSEEVFWNYGKNNLESVHLRKNYRKYNFTDGIMWEARVVFRPRK